MFPWLGLYLAIGFMFAVSIESDISTWNRVNIGLFWFIVVPILLIIQLPIFKEDLCSNEFSSSHFSSPAQAQNELNPFSDGLDTLVSTSQDTVISDAVNQMRLAPDFEQLLQQDIRLLEQSVVVDMKGVARVVPSALINKN